jgi:hypothetical protein
MLGFLQHFWSHWSPPTFVARRGENRPCGHLRGAGGRWKGWGRAVAELFALKVFMVLRFAIRFPAFPIRDLFLFGVAGTEGRFLDQNRCHRSWEFKTKADRCRCCCRCRCHLRQGKLMALTSLALGDGKIRSCVAKTLIRCSPTSSQVSQDSYKMPSLCAITMHRDVGSAQSHLSKCSERRRKKIIALL